MYEQEFNNAVSRITADADLKKRIQERIDDRNMNKKTAKRTGKALTIGICAAAICVTTAFAASPGIQDAVSNIISYFSSENAVEMSDMDELTKYNESIGISDSKSGYTLTLDNVAVDDNFLHIFYTITADDNTSVEYGRLPYTLVRADNKTLGLDSNNNSYYSYAQDGKTYKFAEKYNIANISLPDVFSLELYSADSLITTMSEEEYAKYENADGREFTDSEKDNILYVSAQIDKSKSGIESVTKEIGKPLDDNNILEKVILSPFGNQIVIRTTGSSDVTDMLSSFALFDENNNSLDLLNTGLYFNTQEDSLNSFEFLKGDTDLRAITIVPVKYSNPEEEVGVVTHEIGQYPIEYKISENGSVIVTDVRISDGRVEIDYYLDGYVMTDPGFILMDENGNNAEPGGKLGCLLSTAVHYDTNSYTAVYQSEIYDEASGRFIHDHSISAEELTEKLKKISIHKQDFITLDYDNAVTFELN